ncbi:hypothetical protein HYH03_012300 [Edaphochlamys debaryana]|uniref:Mitochondrial proton/calcium exchanger protein n=1 Tax=Edaphochlamys debaryana TaxID=47281 RepID=A0A836BUC8_9CHLO|nr:hypothetical protein HYH03_012300 [Edaphochlamys debaryana]|eukprot:KAG2489280.1 hypothetical protein HYH03_012300 [Edaphochlamys debaryana]
MALRSPTVRALLAGASKQHGLRISVELLEGRLGQPRGLLELLPLAADTREREAPAIDSFARHVDQLRLLPPLVRESLAAQARCYHTSRSLSEAFRPSAPSLFPDSKRGKDAAAAPKPPAPVPKAEDCDTALQAYDDLSSRLNQLERPASLKSTGEVVKEALVAAGRGVVAVVRFAGSLPGRVNRWRSLSREEWAAKRRGMWEGVKHEAHHYWVGFKLLAFEVRIASGYAFKAARGETLTRRERSQLTRTTADLFRLVPLIVIVVIPFLEFALPVLLRLFPNMLPSTFEDKLKKEEEMKRRLAVRLELARFLQDTVSEMAKDLQRSGKGSHAVTATELYEFLQKVRAGTPVENHDIIRFAQLFNDALTLDNLERLQLVSMAQFVGISPFGTDQYLRNRLRQHLSQIKHDDYEIEREGLEFLTEDELRTACRARGMRAPFGEGAVAFMRRQLQDWLDLSLHRGLPSSLLLMSRAFTITASVRDVAEKKDLAYKTLKETLSVIPDQVVERVEIEALGGMPAGPKAMEKKLEFLKREEELIKEEAAVAKQAKKAKEAKDAADKKAAAAAAPAAPSAAAAPAAQPAVAAAAAPEAGAAGAAAAEGLPEAARATAAAAVAALKPEVDRELAALSEEERAAQEAAARDARVSAILEALLALSASSGVARERQLFMELLRNEMDRLQREFVEAKGPGTALSFSSAGLQTPAGAAPASPSAGDAKAPGAVLAAAPSAASKRLEGRVARLLKAIEAELDSVETEIGDKLQLLDTDRDGVVSKQELAAALSFLKAQLDPTDMDLLFEKLGAAAKDPSSPIKVDELLALAAESRQRKELQEGKEPKPPGPAAAAPAAAPKESVKIHTM